MTYQLTKEGNISLSLDGGAVMFLPSEDNGTPEWAAYKAWLSEGNTPLPAPEPPKPVQLTPAEKLAAAGLTVEELKALLN
jgi:hypothetical protein